MLTCKFSNVDLAGDGGGDQSGAAFLQQLDPALGFGGEGVELCCFGLHKRANRLLLKDWGHWKDEVVDLFWADVRHADTSCIR